MKKILKGLLRHFSGQKIGGGWDYAVFQSNVNPGRVIKIMNPIWIQFLLRLILPFFVLEIPFTRFRMRQIIFGVKGVGKRELFANPKFFGVNYSQDKLNIIKYYLRECTEEEARQVFKKLAALHQTYWTLGFAEVDFKMSGYGMYPSGEVTMSDISRVTFSKSEAKKWMRGQRIFLYRIDEIPRKFWGTYREIFCREITVEKMEKIWGSKQASMSE